MSTNLSNTFWHKLVHFLFSKKKTPKKTIFYIQQVFSVAATLVNEAVLQECYSARENQVLSAVPYLSTSVHVSTRVADGDRTDHLTMVEGVDLPGMTRNTWPYQGIWRKWHRLHLSISTDME